MAIQVKEVHKFGGGIQGSVSELDISAESASLSLNIDPNSEYGALKGIYGDYILTADGWNNPMYSKWVINFFTNSVGDTFGGTFPIETIDKKIFEIFAYDKAFYIIFVSELGYVEERLGGTHDPDAEGILNDDLGIHTSAFRGTDDLNACKNSTTHITIPVIFERSIINTSYIKVGKVADLLKTALETYCEPSDYIKSILNITSYYQAFRPTSGVLEEDGNLTIYSTILGEIPPPTLPREVDGFMGAELITSANDRTFAGASNWANAAGDNAFNEYDETTGGVLTVTPDDDGSNRQYALLDGANFETDMVVGKSYRLTYDLTISSYTKGTLSVGTCNDSFALQDYKEYTAAATVSTETLDFTYDLDCDKIIINAAVSTEFTAVFDNFSLKELHMDIAGTVNDSVNPANKGMYLPDKDLYGDNHTRFVMGNGSIIDATLEGLQDENATNLNYIFLKSYNVKGQNMLLGITKGTSAEVHLYENISAGSSTPQLLGNLALDTEQDPSDTSITAEQRNKILYLGIGDKEGTSSIWIGKVKRKQLDKDINEYKIEKNKLEKISVNVGQFDFNNLIVPTLHHGLNNTNGGIAGAASIYGTAADGSGSDVYADTEDFPTSGNYHRSVNGWVRQCLQNNTSATYTYNDVKEGMIFRLNFKKNITAGKYTGYTASTGLDAFDYLLDLKKMAVGKIEDNQTADESVEPFTKGGDGESLHNGDLFQVVYSLNSTDEIAYDQNNTTSMFRLAYIGSLFGASSTSTNADTSDAYCGRPAYVYAHLNDDVYLGRIKTTSKSDEDILKRFTEKDGESPVATDSEASSMILYNSRTEFLNLEEELNIDNFKISTIAECKSSDGIGGYGGDTTNKNYFSGHGKLWVANKNEHDCLYLLDVTNWDKSDRGRKRLTYKKINLDFSRIHSHLLSVPDESTYGQGLIRFWEKDNTGNGGQIERDTHFGNYQWNPIPTGQFISSICETYSHLPHMGDGAGGGDDNGDGKWRVWVEYSKGLDMAHSRYDLFLFNFRVQPWTGSGDDEGDGISNTSKVVYMFDKTPPYQECYHNTIGNMKSDTYRDIYYPFDKFGLCHHIDAREHTCAGHVINDHGHFGVDNVMRAKGREYTSRKYTHGQQLGGQDISSLHFRQPSGEIRDLTAASKAYDNSKAVYSNQIHLGQNLGWVMGEGRQYVPVRHTLKPYYRKWYFTGNGGGDREDVIPSIAEKGRRLSGSDGDTYVAHVVASFGKLSGRFVKFGGTLKSGRQYGLMGNTFSSYPKWFSHKEGTTNLYENNTTMFTIHDSPVAIEKYGDADTVYEAQGKSNTTLPTGSVSDDVNASDESHVGKKIYIRSGVSRRYYNDFEAGFAGARGMTGASPEPINDRSVVATLGHGKYNQYRFHHKHNGTYNTTTDSSYTGETETTEAKNGYGYGGQYFGKDNYGHYINITTTWACNQNSLMTGDESAVPIFSYNDTINIDGNHVDAHMRVHGWGDACYFIRDSRRRSMVLGNRHSRTYLRGTEFNAGSGGGAGGGQTFSKYGTGYFTWFANSANDFLGDKAQTFQSHYPLDTDDTNSGDYDYIEGKDGSTVKWVIDGTKWENRRIVHCWSTTALTDSWNNINVDERSGRYEEPSLDIDKINRREHREWGMWKTPRCSFRNLKLQSDIGSDWTLKNVDHIAWQERNVNMPDYSASDTLPKLMKDGFLLEIDAPNSVEADIGSTTSRALVVVDTKTSTYYGINDAWKDNDPWDTAHTGVARGFSVNTLEKADNLYSASGEDPNYRIFANSKLFTKNLVPGLADMIDKRPGYDWQRDNDNGGTDTYPTIIKQTLDIYSPILIGQGGSLNKQFIGIWNRGQFKDNTNEESQSMGDFPCYRFDKLWNYWATSSTINGFDLGVYTAFDNNNYPTEGWGSVAGGTDSARKDFAYPYQYASPEDGNAPRTVQGAHMKNVHPALLTLKEDGEIASDGGHIEFKGDNLYIYNVSYLYDGYQEGPLSDFTFRVTPSVDCKKLVLELSASSAAALGLNSRVSHINVYRKNSEKELFRLITSVTFDTSKDEWFFDDDEGVYILEVIDDGQTSSYEGLNGIPQSLDEFTPNYRLSCQLNDFLFVSSLYHPKLEDGDHILLRSKQGRFSVFDWSNDFLDLPTKPVAMAAFTNKIWVFDNNNMYSINPTGLYIEDRTEGIGILNSQSVITTDMGMFWCDRNNIYKHDGQKINQIGTAILKNHANPEWQLGYLDAVNKSEALSYTPKIGYDPINQSIYIVLQGVSKSLQSYRQYESRVYSYDIKQDRWDYYDCPNTKSIATDYEGTVIMSDGIQIYSFRRDKRNIKDFSWDSKTFQLGSSNYDKTLKSLKFTGDLCLYRFNNNSWLNTQPTADGGDIVDEEPDFGVGDNDDHILEIGPAHEDDDLKVYVDGILQNMRVKTRHPVIGQPIGNDPTGEIYKTNIQLPKFGTNSNGLEWEDSFSLDFNSCPEFLSWPNGQFEKPTFEGGVQDLMHIHKGMYLYFSGTDLNNVKQEEFIKVRDIKFYWEKSDDGINYLDTSQVYGSIVIRAWRGQLGTSAYNWSDTTLISFTDINPTRTASPTLLFPKGAKGKTLKIILQNQKSFIDSFAVSYRTKKFK